MPRPPAILVATCGNPFAGDDGFGPAVAARLRRMPLEGVEVLELGMAPAGLLDHLPGRAALMLVDAALCPEAQAGQLLECDWDAPGRPALASEPCTSTHGLSIAAQIELARALGLLPPVVRLLAVCVGEGEAPAEPSSEPRKTARTQARPLPTPGSNSSPTGKRPRLGLSAAVRQQIGPATRRIGHWAGSLRGGLGHASGTNSGGGFKRPISPQA